jgi:uncharacterized protein
MKRRRLLVLCLMLSGCIGSPRTHFYTLDPVPPSNPAPAANAMRSHRLIMVGQVQLPPALDRLSLVTRTGPDQLSVSDENRWAAPLDDTVRRTLAADLAARLPPSRVLAPGDPIPAGGVRTLTVDVQDFIADQHQQEVTLNARWALLDGTPPHPVLTQREAITTKANSPSVTDDVAAMSRALGILADRIAARLLRG